MFVVAGKWQIWEHGGAPAAHGPAEGVYRIATGEAELVRDPARQHGWLLYVNHIQSSHLDLEDPDRLEFEYMAWMAPFIDLHPGAGDEGFSVLHLGGGGCALARFLGHRYPGAHQLVVEIDDVLARLVRDWFELPPEPQLKVEPAEARRALEKLPSDSRDIIIRDVFAGATTPAHLTTVEFTAEVRRVLRPDGLYLLNCLDSPDLVTARAEAATLGTVFSQLAAAADPPMLAGWRLGNLVLAATDGAIDAGTLAGRLRSCPVPARLLDDAATRLFAAGSAPRTDAGVHPVPGPGAGRDDGRSTDRQART